MTRSLWKLKTGDCCRIIRFDDALADSYRIRLMELGFHPGEVVSCVRAPALGAPKVYRVSNTLYSLDDEVALHIHVEVLSGHE